MIIGPGVRLRGFLVGILLALMGAGFLIACSDDPGPVYESEPRQTSEDNVLLLFQQSWRQRDVSTYARLLADDYRYYFDPATRQQLGIEFWDRAQDSLAVGCLFESAHIPRITMGLGWAARSASPAGFAAPRDTWTKLFLTDVFLDVDFMPPGGEVTTFRVEDQTQRFYFRRGRTYPPSGPGDTLVYVVEWRDQGTSAKPGALGEATTWGGIKARCSTAPTRPQPPH